MKNTDTIVDTRPTSFGAMPEPAEAVSSTYTSGEFLRQAGYIISVCLGLGLLTHLLLTVTIIEDPFQPAYEIRLERSAKFPGPTRI